MGQSLRPQEENVAKVVGATSSDGFLVESIVFKSSSLIFIICCYFRALNFQVLSFSTLFTVLN